MREVNIMTTVNITLEIEEGYGDTLNVLKDLISKLKGVASFKIEEDIFIAKTQEQIEQELRDSLAGIKSKKAFEEADENIFTQI